MITSTLQHAAYMQKALELANQSLCTATPNPRVGCVLVNDQGDIVGQGFHARAGLPHAETMALQQAGKHAENTTAYINLEPCAHHGRTPPCCEALVQAGVKQVVIPFLDPDPRVSGLGMEYLQMHGVDVVVGVLKEQAWELNKGFLQRIEKNRPWLRLKLAMSLDARTAMASGESQWISCETSREEVQHWRAQSCAVVTGIGTVLLDNPSMNVRLANTTRQPVRIIVDTHLRTLPEAKILTLAGETVIVTCQTDRAKYSALLDAGAIIKVLPANTQGQVDLPALVAYLAERQFNDVWFEAGASLSGALLQAHCVDELIVYIAPKLLGHDARAMMQLPGLDKLKNAVQFEFSEVVKVGVDLRLTARIHEHFRR